MPAGQVCTIPERLLPFTLWNGKVDLHTHVDISEYAGHKMLPTKRAPTTHKPSAVIPVINPAIPAKPSMPPNLPNPSIPPNPPMPPPPPPLNNGDNFLNNGSEFQVSIKCECRIETQIPCHLFLEDIVDDQFR
ncbi:hypothetical protein DFS34DRAFT_682948, partial [Phlyctochytrium arcticum]